MRISDRVRAHSPAAKHAQTIVFDETVSPPAFQSAFGKVCNNESIVATFTERRLCINRRHGALGQLHMCIYIARCDPPSIGWIFFTGLFFSTTATVDQMWALLLGRQTVFF
jgi:hypothetical protein